MNSETEVEISMTVFFWTTPSRLLTPLRFILCRKCLAHLQARALTHPDPKQPHSPNPAKNRTQDRLLTNACSNR